MTSAAASRQEHDAARKRRFAALFDANYDWVHRSLRRLGVEEMDIEDVAHEMFMTVYAKLDELEEERPPKPWLFAFAARFASSHRRLARHRGVSDDALAAIPGGASPEEEVGRAEAASLAQRALDRLSPELREVFVAYELEEIAMKEIASSLEIPVNTAYSRLRLAREGFATACAAIRGEGR